MSQLCLKISLFLQSGTETKTVGQHTNQQGRISVAATPVGRISVAATPVGRISVAATPVGRISVAATPVGRTREIQIIMFILSARYN
jgi:lipid-binding SYLF domain-containing protein